MGHRIIVENGIKKYRCCRCEDFFGAEEMVKHRNMVDGVGSYCLLCKGFLSRILIKRRRIGRSRGWYKSESYDRPLPINEGEMRHPVCFNEVRNTLITKYSNGKIQSVTFIP